MKAAARAKSSRAHLQALSRVDVIHREIVSGRFPNNDRLATLLGVDARTVRRDIEFMRDRLRAPLEYDARTRGWRYRILGWSPPAARLTEGELLAFFTAEQVLKGMGHTPEAALLRGSLSKLAAHLPEEVCVNLNTLGEALSYQPQPHVGVAPETLRVLARAAAERRTLAFGYHSQHSGEYSRREADVLLLHHFAGDWYAIAFDHRHGELRDFHAGRIDRVELTAKFFDPPDGWNPQNYLSKGFSMMRGGRVTKVEIVFDSYQARWMRERGAFHPEEQRRELPGDELKITFPVGRNGLEAVARFCLTYAGHCRAERPAALRKMIRERLVRALADHRED